MPLGCFWCTISGYFQRNPILPDYNFRLSMLSQHMFRLCIYKISIRSLSCILHFPFPPLISVFRDIMHSCWSFISLPSAAHFRAPSFRQHINHQFNKWPVDSGSQVVMQLCGLLWIRVKLKVWQKQKYFYKNIRLNLFFPLFSIDALHPYWPVTMLSFLIKI